MAIVELGPIMIRPDVLPLLGDAVAVDDRVLAVYLHLARASAIRLQPAVRDKLLVMAALTAHELGLTSVAQACREKLLGQSGRHMLRRWPTIEQALADQRFRSYIKQLRRRYSGEVAEHMLDSLGIELGQERQLYASAQEYALALLDRVPGAAPPANLPAPASATAAGPHEPEAAKPPAAITAPRFAELARSWVPFWLALVVLVVLTAMWVRTQYWPR